MDINDINIFVKEFFVENNFSDFDIVDREVFVFREISNINLFGDIVMYSNISVELMLYRVGFYE